LGILSGTSNDNSNINNNTSEDASNTDKTTISYMKTHSSEKLSATDCKAYKGGGDTVSIIWVGNTLKTEIKKGINSWSDVIGALTYDLAPASNMMKSIYACKFVQTAVESGQMTFSQAVNTQNRNAEPFSDSPVVNGAQTGETILSNLPTDTSTGTLTLSQCEAEYGSYNNSQWAESQAFSDTKSKAAACYQALVAGPMYGIDGQLYIDAYNAGTYSVMNSSSKI
jgi:hypothetical protein